MIYFTADTHFGHEKALNFPERKGFGFTVESWEDLIVDIINKTITKHDRLYILGDFALGGGNFLIKTRMKLKPKDIWLIKGNHCPSDEACKRAFGERFRQVHECKVKEMPCWLSHYPHLIWPKSHYGSFHLFGHIHDGRTDFWNEIPYLADMRSLDVCPESYRRHFGEWGIWSEDEVYNLLIARKGHDPVEWYRQNHGEI